MGNDLQITIFLDASNTFVRFDFAASDDLRTFTTTRFFNIIPGPVNSTVFETSCQWLLDIIVRYWRSMRIALGVGSIRVLYVCVAIPSLLWCVKRGQVLFLWFSLPDGSAAGRRAASYLKYHKCLVPAVFESELPDKLESRVKVSRKGDNHGRNRHIDRYKVQLPKPNYESTPFSTQEKIIGRYNSTGGLRYGVVLAECKRQCAWCLVMRLARRSLCHNADIREFRMKVSIYYSTISNR